LKIQKNWKILKIEKTRALSIPVFDFPQYEH